LPRSPIAAYNAAMCGIVGIVGARSPIEPALLGALRDRLTHRGPDDAGLAFSRDGRTGFGHRRLAILDPTPAGHQPMWNRAGTLVTTYNGEIYNFRELAAELAKNGYSFHTRSDTEVLLAAFEHWGLDAIERFRGMFAFALWSEEMQECVLVRDRLGIKPLYYALKDETLYFASEATALHAVLSKELDQAALGDYLAYGYVPGERSIWRGIMKLRPGHLLVFGANGPIIRRYWSPPKSPDPNTPRAPGVLRQELATAVEQALVSDVPVGAFLSGGLDSSTVVALMAAAGAEIHSYTIDFGFQSRGAADARLVAERYHTDHHERLLTLDGSLDLMRQVSLAYDEPIADESILPTYAIAGEVARDLKVVISGDGGDEIFAGYRWYAKLERIEQLRALLGPLASPLAQLGNHMLAGQRSLGRLRRGFHYLGGPTLENYFRLVGYFSGPELARLIAPATVAQFADDPLWLYRAHWRPELPLVRRLQMLDLMTYLPDDILFKVDRASMRHSLETRVPLLDHRVVEHALRLPADAVYQRGQGKLILSSVAEDLVPESVRSAPKQGFGLQRLAANHGQFMAREAARVESGRLVQEGLVRPGPLAELLERRDEGRNPNRLWLLYALDIWYEAHLG